MDTLLPSGAVPLSSLSCSDSLSACKVPCFFHYAGSPAVKINISALSFTGALTFPDMHLCSPQLMKYRAERRGEERRGRPFSSILRSPLLSSPLLSTPHHTTPHHTCTLASEVRCGFPVRMASAPRVDTVFTKKQTAMEGAHGCPFILKGTGNGHYFLTGLLCRVVCQDKTALWTHVCDFMKLRQVQIRWSLPTHPTCLCWQSFDPYVASRQHQAFCFPGINLSDSSRGTDFRNLAVCVVNHHTALSLSTKYHTYTVRKG